MLVMKANEYRFMRVNKIGGFVGWLRVWKGEPVSTFDNYRDHLRIWRLILPICR